SRAARGGARAGAGAWLLRRGAADAPVAAAAAVAPLRLADLGYRCSTGPLVWNRRAADLMGVPEPGTVPVLWGADIDGGVVHRDPARDRLRYLRLRAGGTTTLVLGTQAFRVHR